MSPPFLSFYGGTFEHRHYKHQAEGRVADFTLCRRGVKTTGTAERVDADGRNRQMVTHKIGTRNSLNLLDRSMFNCRERGDWKFVPLNTPLHASILGRLRRSSCSKSLFVATALALNAVAQRLNILSHVISRYLEQHDAVGNQYSRILSRVELVIVHDLSRATVTSDRI